MCHECRAFESNGPACPSRRSGERSEAKLLTLAAALRIAAMAGSRRLPMGALQSEHAHAKPILRLASRRVKTAAFTAKTFPSGTFHHNFFPGVEADNKRLMMGPLWNGYMARRGNEKPFLSTSDQGITEIFSGS